MHRTQRRDDEHQFDAIQVLADLFGHWVAAQELPWPPENLQIYSASPNRRPEDCVNWMYLDPLLRLQARAYALALVLSSSGLLHVLWAYAPVLARKSVLPTVSSVLYVI